MSDSGSSMNKFTVATSGLKLQSFSEHPPVYLTSVQIFPWSHHAGVTLTVFGLRKHRHSSQSACCIRHCRGLRLVRRLDHCHCWPIFDGRRAAHWLRLPCSPKTLPETSLFRFRSRVSPHALKFASTGTGSTAKPNDALDSRRPFSDSEFGPCCVGRHALHPSSELKAGQGTVKSSPSETYRGSGKFSLALEYFQRRMRLLDQERRNFVMFSGIMDGRIFTLRRS
ncbi:hypothetical protein IWX46DRAFT_599270 [Phyllosticta citricarpa]|uniref:Uncharacterized protein n=1 Tax=Phyllosticta citricarpa TaxID=55181 RepID=A0ABR1MFI4_9PEZI